MKRFFLTLFAALAAGHYVNGMDGGCPPFAFPDKTGKPGGVDKDPS